MPQGVYAGGNAVVVMDPAPLVYVNVFHTGSGPDRFIKRKANEVALLAKVIAPRRSGRMASQIHVSQNRDEKGRFAFGYNVISPVYYSAYVHEGTDPHVYFSYPGKMSFEGTKRFYGQMVYTDMIDHPGNEANPFLQNALVAMVG